VLMVWACDRLARSTKHLLQTLDELNGFGIQFLSQREAIDTEGLDLLFGAFPRNCRIEGVYLKVVALNDMYSAQIRRGRKNASALYDLARKICDLAIDEMLAKRLPEVVDKIAALEFGGKKCGHVFAAKYCHFHFPDDYPIYESSNVEPLVYAYQKSGGQKVSHKDLTENYEKFKHAVESLRNRHGLARFCFRQFDKFLLGYGKDWKKLKTKTMSAAARQKIAAAQKARWAKVKAAQKKSA
jgi:Resolvase, N terminal domain